MCDRCKNKIGGMKKIKGLDVERLLAVGGGAVGSKAMNGIAKNIKFLSKDQNKWMLPAIKVAIGVGGQYQKNPLLKDVGLGFICEGLLHGVEVLAPNVFKGGFARTSGVGVIDLRNDRSVAGTTYRGMEEMHEVAGYNDSEVAGWV